MERQSHETFNQHGARRSSKLLRVAAVVFVAGIFSVQAVTLKATLDRQTAIVGENVTLTLQLDGAQLPGAPNLPAIPGLQVVGTSSAQQSTLGADGKMSTVQSYAFTMTVTQPGEINIPALQLNLNSQRVSSSPIKLKVLTSDPNSPPDSLATNLAFLWLVLPKNDLYVGEAVIGEVRLYLRSEVGEIANPQIPQLTGDGFVLGKYAQGQQLKRNVGKQSFTVIPMQFAATAIKSGTLTIEPLNGSVTLLGGRRDWFGGYSQRVQTALTTEAQTFKSLPLPVENMPPLFSGAVGNYTMTASIGPTNVATGDPITLRVEIAGSGALDAVTLPSEKVWDGFKTYPPTSSVETTDQFGLQGRKIFEQIISPENSDIRELPSITFSFFDPEVKQFRTLTHPATKLTVRPGGVVAAPVIAARPGNNSQDSPPPQQDIVPIKQRLGAVTTNTAPLITRPGFIALQTAPVLAFVAAFIWRKRTDSFANNPRLRRQRQVAATLRTGLANIRTHAAQNKSDEFFAELTRLLQEKLGERLDASASGITEAVIEEKLRPKGVPDSTLGELHDLFQTCNMARYAPVKSSQELSAIIPRLENVLAKLDEVKP
jgi:hypothetical protein